jgi:hypothetical protein
VPNAGGTSYEDRPPAERAFYTGVAMVANVTPIVSAIYAPRCLPGYVLCKVLLAGMSLVAAADQFVLSGGFDRGQTRALLHRGFAGDWYLSGRHTAGDVEAEPLPNPPPPAGEDEQGRPEPPPL